MARPRAWADQIVTSVIVSAGVAEDLLVTAEGSDTITTARLIGSLAFTPEVLTNNITGQQRIDAGIAVVTSNAFSVGLTAMPDPRVSGDAPARGWLWRTSVLLVYERVAGVVHSWRFPEERFDVGSMRKVDKGKLVLIMYKTAIDGASFNISAEGLIRTLCLT